MTGKRTRSDLFRKSLMVKCRLVRGLVECKPGHSSYYLTQEGYQESHDQHRGSGTVKERNNFRRGFSNRRYAPLWISKDVMGPGFRPHVTVPMPQTQEKKKVTILKGLKRSFSLLESTL